jgi:hypothetical protein
MELPQSGLSRGRGLRRGHVVSHTARFSRQPFAKLCIISSPAIIEPLKSNTNELKHQNSYSVQAVKSEPWDPYQPEPPFLWSQTLDSEADRLFHPSLCSP